MAEQDPRNAIPGDDDDLSVEELEAVAGGVSDDTTVNVNACSSEGNCSCGVNPVSG
jgi:hypothetical protein